jgi:hypothetical protein
LKVATRAGNFCASPSNSGAVPGEDGVGTLARNTELREFQRFFGCPVEFSALADQFGFSNETLAIPLATQDRYLLETLQPICDAAAKERNTLFSVVLSLKLGSGPVWLWR